MSPRPNLGRHVQSKTKIILLAFFDSEGIVHSESAPDGKQLTSNSTWSCNVCVNQFAENDRKNVCRATGSCTTTIRPHTSKPVQRFLAKYSVAQLQQPPYSPDLSLCDFFLFARLKKVLKGHRFEATEDIKRNSMKKLLDIPKEEFAKCSQQWQKRWAKCVAAEGYYVEDN